MNDDIFINKMNQLKFECLCESGEIYDLNQYMDNHFDIYKGFECALKYSRYKTIHEIITKYPNEHYDYSLLLSKIIDGDYIQTDVNNTELLKIIVEKNKYDSCDCNDIMVYFCKRNDLCNVMWFSQKTMYRLNYRYIFMKSCQTRINNVVCLEYIYEQLNNITCISSSEIMYCNTDVDSSDDSDIYIIECDCDDNHIINYNSCLFDFIIFNNIEMFMWIQYTFDVGNFDYVSAFYHACRYGNIDVARCIFSDNDYKFYIVHQMTWDVNNFMQCIVDVYKNRHFHVLMWLHDIFPNKQRLNEILLSNNQMHYKKMLHYACLSNDVRNVKWVINLHPFDKEIIEYTLNNISMFHTSNTIEYIIKEFSYMNIDVYNIFCISCESNQLENTKYIYEFHIKDMFDYGSETFKSYFTYLFEWCLKKNAYNICIWIYETMYDIISFDTRFIFLTSCSINCLQLLKKIHIDDTNEELIIEGFFNACKAKCIRVIKYLYIKYCYLITTHIDKCMLQKLVYSLPVCPQKIEMLNFIQRYLDVHVVYMNDTNIPLIESDIYEPELCTICYEKHSNCKFECRHMFCIECLNQTYDTRCPLCRQEYIYIYYDKKISA